MNSFRSRRASTEEGAARCGALASGVGNPPPVSSTVPEFRRCPCSNTGTWLALADVTGTATVADVLEGFAAANASRLRLIIISISSISASPLLRLCAGWDVVG